MTTQDIHGEQCACNTCLPWNENYGPCANCGQRGDLFALCCRACFDAGYRARWAS
jgi:hypothetical protein